MSPEPRTELEERLKESQRIFNAALAQVTEAEASRTPREGGWTPLAIVEHITITEGSLSRWMGMSIRKEDAQRDPAREDELRAKALNRSTPIEAPERVRPTGKFTSLAEATAAFNAVRENTFRFATENEAALDLCFITHPIFGETSMRQMLVLSDSHCLRHAAQIEEIVRDLRA